MNNFVLQKTLPKASRIAFGCMGLGGTWDSSPINKEHIHQGLEVFDAALASDINFFDLADIYTRGKAEEVFGQVLDARKGVRDNIFIQSKCGIRFEDDLGPKRYDLSFDWITASVDNILTRLNTSYIDILMLHRPDALMQTDEVARAFEYLKTSGKVNYFGVSNMHAHQIAALQKSCDEPLIANQMELHLAHTKWIDEDIFAGHPQANRAAYSSGLLNYCQDQGIQVQSWGSLSQGAYTGNKKAQELLIRSNPDAKSAIEQTCQLITKLSKKYSCSLEAINLAWLMKHPAGIQPVIGTTDAARIEACAQAVGVQITNEEWYALYVAARGTELP